MNASVAVVLDTTAPTLRIAAPAAVEPPDDLMVTVHADEPLGAVSMALVDSQGTLKQLGFERVDEVTLRLLVPTMSLSTGRATLLLSVADEVLNITQRSVVFTVERARAFDVNLTIEHGHDVEFTQHGGFTVELTVEHAHGVDLTLDGAHEVILDLDKGHAITLEVY